MRDQTLNLRLTRRTLFELLLAAGATSPFHLPASAAAASEATSLGHVASLLPGIGGFDGGARGVNEAGVTVGWATTSPVDGEVTRAVRWVDCRPTLLETLGGAANQAMAINNRGEIVGFSSTVDGDIHACLWDGEGRAIDLGTLGGSESLAMAINDRGHIVGFSTLPSDKIAHAALWIEGEISDLGAITEDADSFATGVNDAGLVVGYETFRSHPYGDAFRALRWRDGVPTLLTGLEREQSIALGVNERDAVVGVMRMSTGRILADDLLERGAPFIWTENALTILPSFGGSPCQIQALNDAGQAVGIVNAPPVTPGNDPIPHAVLWDESRMMRLEPSSELGSVAYAVNGGGVIVGETAVDADGTRAVVWSRGALPLLAPEAAISELTLPEPIWTAASSVDVNLAHVGVLYGSQRGVTHAIDAATGRRLWSLASGRDYVQAETMAGDLLIVRADDLRSLDSPSSGTTLIAIDITAHRERWRLDFHQSERVLGAVGGVVLAQSSDVLPPGVAPPSTPTLGLAAVEAQTGAVRWRVAESRYGLVDQLAGQAVYAMVPSGANYDLAALNVEDGTARWRSPVHTYEFNPKANDSAQVYGVSSSGLWAVDRASGVIAWRAPIDEGSIEGVTPVPGHDVVIVTTGAGKQRQSTLIGLDAASGARRWTTPIPGIVLLAPSLVGDVFVIGNADDRLPWSNAAIFGVDPISGDLRWQVPLGSEWSHVEASSGSTAFVLARSNGFGLKYERLLAVDTVTGQTRWKCIVDSKPGSFINPGVQLVDDRHLYISGAVSRGTTRPPSDVIEDALVALDRETGQVAWRIAAESERLPAEPRTSNQRAILRPGGPLWVFGNGS